MTQEEKARAYDEALEKAREFHKSKEGIYVLVAETIFPDLRESEDERIRKEIIDFIQWAEDRGMTRHDYHQAKRPAVWLAYLEKQKDSKWSPSEDEMCVLYKLCYISNQVTDEDDTKLTRLYQDLKREYFNGRSFENMFPSEKQKGQKPWKVGANAYFTPEQKPVEIHNPTDEEVESWKNELTEFKKFATKQAKENQLHISYTRDVMWENFCSELLSFVNSRKPAEWSEEDEDMLNSCISSIEEAKENRYAYKETDGDTSYDHEIAWLKSLRNRVGKDSLQTHWKPSEEQMEALQNAVALAAGNKALAELYEQLKAL